MDQGVTDISSFGTDGLAGTIRYLSDQGAVLDNAGQLMGLWAMKELPVNVLAFPSSIRSMRFYGPQPHTDVDCTVRISGIAVRSVTADMELVANGAVWCAISDWEDRRFDTDDVLWPFLRFPEVRTVAQRQPGGWWLVMERWTDSASRELLARRFASLSERADYESRNPLEQRNWLLGRAALKDAVRQHRWALGDDSMFPSEVVIGHDEAGAPYISAPGSARALHVSVSHSGRLGVAHIGTDGPVGIDIERVQARGGRFATLTLTDTERAMLDGLDESAIDLHLTAMWAAKEAAAKAHRTGLGGRPKHWAVTAFEPDRLRILDTWVDIAVLDMSGAGAPIADFAAGRPATESDVYVVAWTSGREIDAAAHPARMLPGEPR